MPPSSRVTVGPGGCDGSRLGWNPSEAYIVISLPVFSAHINITRLRSEVMDCYIFILGLTRSGMRLVSPPICLRRQFSLGGVPCLGHYEAVPTAQ
jgi:hypothetical protein